MGFTRFKEVAEKKKGGLDDDDLESLVSDQAGSVNELWRLTGLQSTTGMSGIPTATVKMMGPDGVERFGSAGEFGELFDELCERRYRGSCKYSSSHRTQYRWSKRECRRGCPDESAPRKEIFGFGLGY